MCWVLPFRRGSAHPIKRHCSICLVQVVKENLPPTVDFSLVPLLKNRTIQGFQRTELEISPTLWQAQWGVQRAGLCVKVPGVQSWLPYMLTKQVPSLSISVLICKGKTDTLLSEHWLQGVNIMRKVQYLTSWCSLAPSPPSFLIQGIIWAGSLKKRMIHLPGSHISEWRWKHLLLVTEVEQGTHHLGS